MNNNNLQGIRLGYIYNLELRTIEKRSFSVYVCLETYIIKTDYSNTSMTDESISDFNLNLAISKQDVKYTKRKLKQLKVKEK